MPLDRIATAAFRASGATATTEGQIFLESEFEGVRRKKVKPCSDAFDMFLRLDAPRSIDSNGMRTVSAPDTAAIVPEIDHGGPITYPGDGAWLECNDVAIPPGKALRFYWGFLRFDGFPGNDYCVFHAEGTGGAVPVILSQVIELEINGNARQTEGPGGRVWIEHLWQPPDGFNGRLRWIMTNGQLILNPDVDQPSNRRFAWPSAMVLCGLDIV